MEDVDVCFKLLTDYRRLANRPATVVGNTEIYPPKIGSISYNTTFGIGIKSINQIARI